ncbi:hypothetical protein SprV_0301243900 [Sparganum proliferum]
MPMAILMSIALPYLLWPRDLLGIRTVTTVPTLLFSDDSPDIVEPYHVNHLCYNSHHNDYHFSCPTTASAEELFSPLNTAMSFPFRWIFFVVNVLTLAALAVMMVEMFTPYLYDDSLKFTGLIYKCKTRPTAVEFIKHIRGGCCRNLFASDLQTVGVIMTLILVAIFFLASLFLWYYLLSASESWPRYCVHFAVIGILWMIVALVAQSIVLAFVIQSKPADSNYSYAFAAVVAVHVLIIIIIVLLTLLVICKSPSEKGDDAVEPFFWGTSGNVPGKRVERVSPNVNATNLSGSSSPGRTFYVFSNRSVRRSLVDSGVQLSILPPTADGRLYLNPHFHLPLPSLNSKAR